MHSQRFEGQVALVTGGSGAMGQGIASRLRAEGATVLIADRVAPAADAAVTDGFHELDVTRPDSWASLTERIRAAHDGLDLMVNNAGVVMRESQTIDRIPLEEWQRVFAVNVDGVLLGTQAAIGLMRERAGGGAIVNLGSVASYVGSRDGGAYGASKAAVRNLTKQAALSVARMGLPIRVNAVHPGYVWTPLIEAKLVAQFGSLEAARQAVAAMNPMNRIVEVGDVAAAVAFLASGEARMITGADLVIDGGRLIQ